MAKITAGGQTINLTPAIGPSSGGGPVQEITSFGFGSVTIQWDYNGATISMVISGKSPEAKFVDELASDVWLLGDVPMRFRLWAVWQDWDADGDDRLSMQGVTYGRLLSRRLVGPDGLSFAPGTDAGDILWGLWEHTQGKDGGDLGVTQGASTTGVTAGRNYVEGDELGALTEQLCDALSIWRDIDADLVFTAKQLDTIPFLAQPLQLGVNVRGLQRAGSGANYANSILGTGDMAATPVWRTDPDIATNPRGLWEKAVGWPTVSADPTLVEHTEGALTESMQQLSYWNVEMVPGRWILDSRLRPGDFAVLVVPRTLAAPVGTPTARVAVQVTSMTINFTNDGDFNVKLVAAERTRPLPDADEDDG